MKKLGCSRPYSIHFFIALAFFFLLAGFILAGATQAQAAGTCPPNLTSYWTLDETAGTTFADFVGSHDAACIDPACPGFAGGRILNALLFDGIDDGIDVPADATFNWGLTDSFSVEFWMKGVAGQTCSTNTEVAIGRDDGSLQWWLGCNTSGAAKFRLHDNSGNGPTVSLTGPVINDGTWHHVVGVRQGILGQNILYVDGQKVQSQATTYTSGFDSSASLNIGHLANEYYFHGSIDEVALYHRALTGVEILQHYRDGSVGLRQGYCADCTNPVRIMPIGDSITSGYRPSVTNDNYKIGYRQKLYLDLSNLGYPVNFVGSQQSGALAIPSFDIDHEGHGAYTAALVSSSVYTWLTTHPAEVLLLHIGTNEVDGTGNTSAAYVEAILDEIDQYEADTSSEVTVILSRIINEQVPIGAITTFNNNVVSMAQNRIANGDKIIIVDQEHALTYPDNMEDALHPTQAGYEKMADVWFNGLNTFLPVCGDAAPVIISTPLTLAAVGQSIRYDVAATGKPAPAYSLKKAPNWLNIDTNTGLVTGTPPSSGNFAVEIQATNVIGGDIQSIILNALVCPSGMSHYWTLEEDTSPYRDFYGGIDATCTSCPSLTTGRVNNAQLFNGNNEVNVAADTTFDWGSTDSFSIEFWLKGVAGQTCNGNFEVVIGRDAGVSPGLQWYLGCNETGSAKFLLLDNSGDGPAASLTGPAINDGTWHHVVGVRDGVFGQNILYVDGEQTDSQDFTYSSGFDAATVINMGHLAGEYLFHGSLDEVAFYNRSLPGYEVLQHYNDGLLLKGYCINNYTLTVSKSGTGTGTIASNDGGISCGSDCTEDYTADTDVTLTATPAAGSTFAGWSGDATGTTNPRTVTMNDNKNITATFTAILYTLNVPAVHGSVAKSPNQATYVYGTDVQLTATPDAGYTFTNWSGDASGSANPLTVTMNADKDITANFTAIPRSLDINAVNGTVAKNPDQSVYADGTNVQLTATPAAGYTFTGWSGDATGSANPLAVTMNGDKNITANFAAIDYFSFITPQPAEKMPSGETYRIQWTAPPEAVKFKLLYSMDSGTTWNLIDKNILERAYNWPTPPQKKDKMSCRIKVVAYTAQGVKVGKVLSELFTIEGTVRLTTPNGGETLTAGTPLTITWQTSPSVQGSVAKVILKYTKNGGITWKTLQKIDGDPGSFSGTVPTVPKQKNKCRVMVVLKDATGKTIGKDTSDLFFSIQP